MVRSILHGDSKRERAAKLIKLQEKRAVNAYHTFTVQPDSPCVCGKTVVKVEGFEVDGLWECVHCKYSNPIILLDGPHVLGILRCENCKHVRGSHSLQGQSTPVLTPVTPYSPIDVDTELAEHLQPYGYMCRCCGLTWRATVVTANGRPMFDFPAKSGCFCGADPWKTEAVVYSMFYTGKDDKLRIKETKRTEIKCDSPQCH
ncbi:hypothetical protein BDV96DRAFT_649283 [Lophiotrema nucula]|uniref:Probable double zinc ribbon domain-containing protein n=1 Tax=Lophiotrema nucula TaxID=690887 RepID=A0A6A5YZB9_9PLEO|nr:hypothetical protein BDV96DRAFT_649283 [Lophiotrema nucula]